MDGKTVKIAAVAIVIVMIAAGIGIYVVNNNNNNKSSDSVDITAALEVYGNADKDYKIDSADLDIIKKVLNGDEGYTLAKYPLADANYNGSVTQDDVSIVQSIIDKKPTEIWHVNHTTAATGDYVASTSWPITSSLGNGAANALMLYTMLDIEDKIKGINYSSTSPPDSVLYPEFSKMTSLGTSTTKINTELVSNYVTDYKCTAIITADNKSYLATEEPILEEMNVDVVRVEHAAVDPDAFGAALLLLGFLFQKENNATEVVEWLTEFYSELSEKLSALSPSDIVTANASSNNGDISTKNSDYTGVVRTAGAKTLMDNYSSDSSSVDIDAWYYVDQYNADYIIQLRTGSGMGGTWYKDNALDMDKLKACTDSFNLTKAYAEKHVYVVSGDIPVVGRVAFTANIFYPEIIQSDWVDEKVQEYVNKFLNGAYDVSELKFVYSMNDMGL